MVEFVFRIKIPSGIKEPDAIPTGLRKRNVLSKIGLKKRRGKRR